MSSSDHEDENILPLQSGHHSEQGIRPTMEDEYICYDRFCVKNPAAAVQSPLSLFGVFDGHGGRLAAEFTRDHLQRCVVEALESGLDVEKALKASYLKVDSLFVQQQQAAKKESRTVDCSGTTAVSCLLSHRDRKLWVANAGDSRAVLCTKGMAVPLSVDHKADRPDEVERIRMAGGFVVHRRVMGELAVSRAIGDLDFKEEGFSFVVAEPEVVSHTLSPDDEFILLACDGLYDVMSNDDACAYIRKCFQQGMSAEATASEMVKHAVSNLNTRDNVTAIVVRLKFPLPVQVTRMPSTSNLLQEEEVMQEEEEEVEEEQEQEEQKDKQTPLTHPSNDSTTASTSDSNTSASSTYNSTIDSNPSTPNTAAAETTNSEAKSQSS